MTELQLSHTTFDDNSGQWQVRTNDETYVWCNADDPTLRIVEPTLLWNVLVMNEFAETVYRGVPDLALRVMRGPMLLTLDPDREPGPLASPVVNSVSNV